jgi:SpoIID/LytB domain protein
VLPDGDGGSETRGGNTWRVRLVHGKPAVVRWHVVVGSGRAVEGERARLQQEAAAWRERGYAPKTFELGTVFGLRGEVIDMRKLVVAVSPKDDLAAARDEAHAIAARYHVDTSLHPVVATRPTGILEAVDERGTTVRNEGVIWFAPATEGGTLALDPRPDGKPGPERHSYGGEIYVTIGSDGKLAAANAVPEDRLLAGLLPSEIGSGAPPEALKAQAVAARNELFAKIGTRHLTDPYRLCAATHCQVYAGAAREDARSTAAVAATRGELLVHPDGTVVDAVYSANCGGHTEDNDRGWGGAPDPSLRGVPDAEARDLAALAPFARVTDENVRAFLEQLPASPSCAAAKGQFRWTARVEASLVESKAGVGALRAVAVLERGVSGRVVRLRLDGDRGSKEVRGELEVRRAFGMLKSALFLVELERDAAGRVAALRFTGGGHGHGIGMCQSGAVGMAERGHGYREILGRYYHDAAVRRFY